jgi:putative endopeptidase
MLKAVWLSLSLCCLPALPQPGPNANVDSAVASPGPCDDFYQYACGPWLDANPIPKQEAAWGRFDELNERNTAILREILENSRAPEPGRSVTTRQIGDYYEACMNTSLIDQRGTAVLDDEMARISRIDSAKSILAEVVSLHTKGVSVFWGFSSQPDNQNSTVMLAGLDQGGLTLPGRAYYFHQDERSSRVRTKFLEHAAAMLIALGHAPDQAREEAATVLKLETRLARNALDRQDLIDPTKTSHKMTVDELSKLAPHLDWPAYFQAMNAPAFHALNVRVPGFMQGVDALLSSASLKDIKTYLLWRLLSDSADALPSRFVDLNFAFFGTVLQGAQELKPRWWRCTKLADAQLGEAVGKAFVARTFGAAGKEKMLRLVHEIETSLEKDIRELPWMTEATRAQALLKLRRLKEKIGYPDRWIDYSSVKITRDDFLGNQERLSAFAGARELAKIGKPSDPSEWDMTPATVNADYDPQHNDINFPAGILQPPYFDVNTDDAENLGAIGLVIGHELTHGFDNNGRRFDADGNLRDWWKPADDQAFQKRAECLIQEYSSFEFAPGMRGNGELTLGENIADNGGMRIAYLTLERLLDQSPGSRGKRDADGRTPEQRFFLAFGRSWCQNLRDEVARHRTLTNEHSLPRWRVNGTVQNMPEFQQAFACRVGQAMVRAPVCRVW